MTAPVTLLDGGMGRELRLRGVEILGTIWSADALEERYAVEAVSSPSNVTHLTLTLR